ncbi:hypothetical protein CWI35_13445 [[Bacillus] caldolyticus]|uniref:Uncharacterized protein n=1 Tax=Bacillus caldolyticus TaxID=1394 RepID=A0ABM6QPN7_BACCL|nr:hypothetical protein CWI35_13445 [[Bacillus] caldolyticus]
MVVLRPYIDSHGKKFRHHRKDENASMLNSTTLCILEFGYVQGGDGGEKAIGLNEKRPSALLFFAKAVVDSSVIRLFFAIF